MKQLLYVLGISLVVPVGVGCDSTQGLSSIESLALNNVTTIEFHLAGDPADDWIAVPASEWQFILDCLTPAEKCPHAGLNAATKLGDLRIVDQEKGVRQIAWHMPGAGGFLYEFNGVAYLHKDSTNSKVDYSEMLSVRLDNIARRARAQSAHST